MYPIEYMWTNEETINTGISIETVRESNKNPQDIFKDSESIHLSNLICTGALLRPTSKKHVIAKIVVNITHVHVIIWEPVTPNFLPKKPDKIEPNKGNTIRVKYII